MNIINYIFFRINENKNMILYGGKRVIDYDRIFFFLEI